MKQFIAFTKKEFFESHATYRVYILLVVFAIFGVMGPMMALLTPVIFEMMAAELAAAGMVITPTEPTALDSWTQFFGTFAQMGTLAIAIIFSGIMANELNRGTLVNLLTKGLKRHTVILAKLFSATVLWTIAMVFSVSIAYMYTAFYFETEAMPYFILTFGAPWIFGIFLITLLIFGGTVFGNFYGALAICIGTFFALILVNIVPAAARFNPATLAGGTLGLLTDASTPADIIPAVVVSVISIVCLVLGSIIVFNKKTV